MLAADGEFGVCLIERGSEVGGGDQRLGVGVVAQVAESAELPDGRWAVVAVGTRRIRVDDWLPDDPYPRAEVTDLPDPPPTEAELSLRETVTASLRSALEKLAELGGPASAATTEFSADPVLASYQLCALAPISTIDTYRLLCASTVGVRLAALHELLPDVHELLDARLGGYDQDG